MPTKKYPNTCFDLRLWLTPEDLEKIDAIRQQRCNESGKRPFRTTVAEECLFFGLACTSTNQGGAGSHERTI